MTQRAQLQSSNMSFTTHGQEPYCSGLLRVGKKTSSDAQQLVRLQLNDISEMYGSRFQLRRFVMQEKTMSIAKQSQKLKALVTLA